MGLWAPLGCPTTPYVKIALYHNYILDIYVQEVATNKITKWLQKDAFVRVTIEASGERKKEAQDLQVCFHI